MNRRCHGYTLIELLVVMAILGVLFACMLPGIQAAREAASRNQCRLNLVQLARAAHRHEAAHAVFPAGVRDESGPIVNLPQGLHQSWTVELLPYLDEQNKYDHIDRQQSVYDDENAAVRGLGVAPLRCPGQISASPLASGYAGVHHDVEATIDADNHGMLFLNSRVAVDDVRDGLAHTLLLGEKLVEPDDLGWMSGTRATLRNTGLPLNVTGVPKPPSGGFTADEFGFSDSDYGFGFDDGEPLFDEPPPEERDDPGATSEEGETWAPPAFTNRVEPQRTPRYVGGFSSPHAGGVYFAFADGRVEFLADAVDPQLLQQLGHRADGQPTTPPNDRKQK